ncbi:hypothetical protein MMC22_008705 [Lobaria immixta]|nr:hypothetical protein [Lobaria immixta]
MSTTPSHHPTYHVNLTTSVIRQIVNQAFPEARLVSATPLPSGASYNNRIYVVHISEDNHEGQSKREEELILKVCGRFWTKVMTVNEVSCLRLIYKSCPELPVPRVISYSADRKMDGVDQEWILMTKLPGKPLASIKLSEDDMSGLMSDLATILTSLRTKVDTNGLIGNLVHVANDPQREAPESYLDYYRAILEDRISIMETDPRYQQNKPLSTKVKAFIINSLPHLPIFADPQVTTSVLTHADLSTSNILVSPGPNTPPGDKPALRISGLVDWEFSGFFSPFDEFLAASEEIFDNYQSVSDLAQSSVDPSRSLPKLLLQHLHSLGVSTPVTGAVKRHWHTATRLHQLQENLAPWWLREESQGESLNQELHDAAEKVKAALVDLERI